MGPASRRRGVMIAVLAAVTVTATGCTSAVPGEPRQAPYRPMSIGSITASMAHPVEDAAAYSRDGSLVATRTRDGLCIQPTDRAVGAADGEDRVCADLGTAIGQVLFSPDGSTVAALEYRQATYRGRLWVISVDDGHARQVAPLDEQDAGMSGTTGTTRTAGPGSAPSPADSSGESEVPYTSIAWPADGSLLALAVRESGQAHLMRTDPDSATTSDLGTVTPGDSRADGILLAGGGVALVPLMRTPDGPPRLVVVDLTGSGSRTLVLTGDMITDSTQAMPLAVAPSGRSALLWVTDPVNFVQSPPIRADLRTGVLAPVEGADDLMPTAAGYSPDGSQLALVAVGAHDKHSTLFVMPVDGGTPRTVTAIDTEVTPGTGLSWTSTNLLVPYAAGGAISLDGLAPWQLSG